MDTLTELATLVKDMRDAQKAYFKSRRGSDLDASKAKERKVDLWLEKNCAVIPNSQKSLF